MCFHELYRKISAHIIYADHQENSARLEADHILQPIEHPGGGIAFNPEIRNLGLREHPSPIAARRDRITEHHHLDRPLKFAVHRFWKIDLPPFDERNFEIKSLLESSDAVEWGKLVVAHDQSV